MTHMINVVVSDCVDALPGGALASDRDCKIAWHVLTAFWGIDIIKYQSVCTRKGVNESAGEV